MDQRIALLREGYATDVIDLETFERFVGLVLEGGPVALPHEVLQLGRTVQITDAPGGVLTLRGAVRRVEKAAPQHTRTFDSILKAAWTESNFDPRYHDWDDGKGAVHSVSLAEHQKNLNTPGWYREYLGALEDAKQKNLPFG